MSRIVIIAAIYVLFSTICFGPYKIEGEKQQNNYNGILKEWCIDDLRDENSKNKDNPFLPRAKTLRQEIQTGGDIADLLNEGKIEIKAMGAGIEKVDVSVRKLVSYSMTVQVPLGSYFVSQSILTQNMVTTAKRNIILTDSLWQTVSIPAACANMTRLVPEDYIAFTISRSPPISELTQILPYLDSLNFDFATRQAAVWIITDDANYNDLGKLVSQPQSQFSKGIRIINEVTAARAIEICATAGIIIYYKRIWSDRQSVLSGLDDVRLRNLIEKLQVEEPKYKAKLKELEPAFREKVSSLIEWIDIPEGNFTMGDSEINKGMNSNEAPHKVKLSSFKMSKFEVTFEQYDLFCEATGRSKPGDQGWGRDKRPVISVSWYDAAAFAEWLGYRLPTDAEWEYACRAGTTTTFNTGNNLLTSQSNYNGNHPYNNNAKGENRGKTLPAGSFPANTWGLYDMHGNVWEWCSDWYFAYSKEPQNNPKGPLTGLFRVCRGGGYTSRANECQSAFRNPINPGNKFIYVGFRLVADKP
jgi:sulfatase modifying factor 1